MPLDIFLKIGVPRHFLTENELAVDQRGTLAVGTAKVETDPASVEMASQRFCRLDGSRRFFQRTINHLHFVGINPAHDFIVEGALAFRRVNGGQFGGKHRVARNRDLVSAAHPEKTLYKTFHVTDVGFLFFRARRTEDNGGKGADAFRRPFQGNDDLLASSGSGDHFAELAVP
ncbi:hypothetical protein SDC9_193934 [bioreactor metagenome]|uniref:Uncharacterized protein n=1 Tax=bioreactor metagenome TaxID=1076179 RepID=A0A645I519_9ZZZZ